jgi:hypothetical protein
MPEHAVQIGVGDSVADAWESLQPTLLQSVGRDSGERAALVWAHYAGWIGAVDDLEPADDDAARAVDEPIGETDWSDDAYSYVACLYGADGTEPGDCTVRVGEDDIGLWWLDDGDDDVRESAGGPYDTEEVARDAAERLAASEHEGEAGEDAEAMQDRLLDERAGRPDPDGEWCVWWETAGDDEHAVERYATRDAAEAAAQRSQAGLKSRFPGDLLCGYTVRQLVDDHWIEVDDE